MIEIVAAALVGVWVGSISPDIYGAVMRQELAPLAAMHAGERIGKDPHDQERAEVRIKWVKASFDAFDNRVKGAAILSADRKKCVVILPEIETDGDPVYVLGHEVLHCFKSRFHSGPPDFMTAEQIDIERELMLSSVLPVVVTPEQLADVRGFLDEPEKCL